MESCIHCMGTMLGEQCMGGGERVLWHSVDLVAGDGEHQRVPISRQVLRVLKRCHGTEVAGLLWGFGDMRGVGKVKEAWNISPKISAQTQNVPSDSRLKCT